MGGRSRRHRSLEARLWSGAEAWWWCVIRSRSWNRRRSKEDNSSRRAFGKCRLVQNTAGLGSCSLLHHVKNTIDPKQQHT